VAFSRVTFNVNLILK